jgi:hypothetical protein
MARQRLGPKKTAKLRRQLGLPIVKVMVRGNTDHRLDLCLEDGAITCLYWDGVIEKTTRRWKSEGEEGVPP